MRLKTLTYTSRARLDHSDRDLREIHEAARHLNALDGITGLLLFDGVRYLQILEGSEEAIDHLAERLRMDPRHGSFEVRDERFVERRSFSDWSMNLFRLNAGYAEARADVDPLLPEDTSPAVRDLIFRMTDRMALQE